MNQAKIKNWLQFLTVGIWRVTDEEATPLQQLIYACIKIFLLSIRQFTADRIPVRASALTYSTLISIIPILALLFAIARGLGFDALMENQFRTRVTQQQAELIITWVNSYL